MLKKGFKDDLMIDLNDWKNDISIYWYGEDDRKDRSGLWAWSVGHFEPSKFDMPIRLPSGDVSGQEAISNQKLTERTESLSSKYCCTELAVKLQVAFVLLLPRT